MLLQDLIASVIKDVGWSRHWYTRRGIPHFNEDLNIQYNIRDSRNTIGIVWLYIAERYYGRSNLPKTYHKYQTFVRISPNVLKVSSTLYVDFAFHVFRSVAGPPI